VVLGLANLFRPLVKDWGGVDTGTDRSPKDSLIHMRLAFVIRLGSDSRPSDGLFEGWVEEVDSCTELRFRSTNELLGFLGQRFDLVTSAVASKPADIGKQIATGKKSSHKRKPTQ